MLLVSALLVAGVAITTYLFDADLSGVRPSFGSGVDAVLGNRVVRDFTADQEAAARALSSGDQSQLESHLTGNALQDVAQQISSASAGSLPTVTFRPQLLSVIQARDPNDPSVIIEVQEDGVKTLVTTSQSAAPTEQSVTFHGDFWMRESNGHFLITDQAIQVQPSSPLPALAVTITALFVVGAAAVLAWRWRSKLVVSPAPARAPMPSAGLVPAPTQPIGSQAQSADLVVRTFGGLHLMQGERDWVQALEQRSVTGFVWQRLLIGAILDPASRPSRDELARQVNPTVDRKTQLKRMRNLYRGLGDLPPALKDRILVEPRALSFRLDGCDIDAINLIKASNVATGRETLAPSETQWLQRVYEQSARTFLPDFENVEDLATDHHPTCTDLVKEVRTLLATKRADLAVVLADTYVAGGRSAETIAVLEPAVRDHPQRKDLADRLAAAYRSAGRDAEAKALIERFA